MNKQWLQIPEHQWTPCGSDDADLKTRLLTCIVVNDLHLHLEAWEVHETDGGVQYNVDPACNLDAMMDAVGATDPFTTTEIGGRKYVIIATPYCE